MLRLRKDYKHIKSIAGYIFICAGVILGILAFVLAHNQSLQPLDKLAAPDFTRDLKNSPGKPSKSDIDSYSTPPDHPKFIEIPSIGVPRSEVVSLGMNPDRSIAVPDSSYVTGWYDASAKPGEEGVTFVYGHVAGWNSGGIFYNLNRLKPGDNVIITRGDNKTYTYQVVSSKTYPYNAVDMSTVLSPAAGSTSGLNLMTCTGKVIPGSKPVNFDERLVVFTKLVNTD